MAMSSSVPTTQLNGYLESHSSTTSLSIPPLHANGHTENTDTLNSKASTQSTPMRRPLSAFSITLPRPKRKLSQTNRTSSYSVRSQEKEKKRFSTFSLRSFFSGYTSDYDSLRDSEYLSTYMEKSKGYPSTESLKKDLQIVNNVKNGKGLRCLHTFCSDCMQQVLMIKKSGIDGYKCPTCLRFSQKGDYTHLFVMDDYFDIFKMVCGKNQNCQNCAASDCKKVQSAEWRCLNCKINLCSMCQASHDAQKAFRGHKYISNKRVPLYLINQSVYCADHPNQLEGNLYCKQCEKCVCQDCLVTYHQGHPIETIMNASDRITEVVDAGIKKIENDMKELTVETSFLHKESKVLEDAYDATEKEYKKNYEDTLKKLKKAYEKNIEELNKKREEDNKKIENALKEIEEQVKDMKKTLFLTKYALENTRGSSFIKALDHGLQNKIVDEGNKTLNSHILNVQLPNFETDKYVNLDAKCKALIGEPSYKPQEINYEITKFCNGRQIGGKIEKVLNTMSLVTVFNVNYAPSRIGLIDDKIWMCEIPNDDYVLGRKFDISIYKMTGELVKTFRPQSVLSVHDLAQVNETDVILAGGNGLFAFDTDGNLNYKILNGHYCYVSTAGHKVASVNEDANEVIILKYVGSKWMLHNTFKLVNLCENVVSIHLVKDVLYVSEQSSHIHLYNLDGKPIHKYFKASSDISFRLCGSDSHSSVFSTTFKSKYIHILSSYGQWSTAQLAGIEKIEDVCVKGEFIYVLQDCSDYNNFRYRHKLTIYTL